MSDVEGGDYVDANDVGDEVTNNDGVQTTTTKTTIATSRKPPMTLFGICDMRILCMFVNGFNISMILVGVFVTGLVDNMVWKSMGSALAAGLPGLVLSGVGLYGCYTFELWALYLASGGFLVALLMDLILLSWVGMVVTTFVLVPHIAFTTEIRNGVLTKENYSQQEYLNESGRDFVDQAHEYIAPVTNTNTTN